MKRFIIAITTLLLTACSQGVRVNLPECEFSSKVDETSTAPTTIKHLPCLTYTNGRRVGNTKAELEDNSLVAYRAMLAVDQNGNYKTVRVE